MKINATPDQFLNSITGLSALTGASLLITRRYNLAAAIFAALALGSTGVAWDRYSTKSGAPLDIRVFGKKRLPDQDEMDFIVTHLPYAFLAVACYYLGKNQGEKEGRSLVKSLFSRFQFKR
jgi:hypothetical protein